MDTLRSITKLAHPPQNIIGSTLFLSYIVLALYATIVVTTSLWRQYSAIEISKTTVKRKEDRKTIKEIFDARKRHIKIYVFFVSISFATTSWYMGTFLVKSYARWSGQSDEGLSWGDLSIDGLKGWMLGSSLFESFAKELVGDGPGAAWTQGAVLGTWFWNIWMGEKVQQRGFSTREMAPYILLSQILPISLTVSLFIIKLHLSALELTALFSPFPISSSTTTTPKRTTLTLPTIILNATLFALPSLRESSYFVPLILLTRFILLIPYSGRVSLRDAQVVQSIAISGGFVVAQLVMMGKVSGGMGELVRGVCTGREAVKSLGFDALIGAAVHLVLGWGGGV